MIKILVSISHIIAAVFVLVGMAAFVAHQFDAAASAMLVAIFFQLKTMRPGARDLEDRS